MEPVSSAYTSIFNEATYEEKEKKEETIPPPEPKMGASLEKVKSEEKLKQAERLREGKNKEVQTLLEKLLTRMKEDKGTLYVEWIKDFNVILETFDKVSYDENEKLFNQVIHTLTHPPVDTPPSIYIPQLKGFAISLFLKFDSNHGQEALREYLYASFQVPDLVSEAKKELDKGNKDKCLLLLERAKEFVSLHYSCIPLISDRRIEQQAEYTLLISELEKEIDPNAAIKTLTEHVKKLSEGMNLEEFVKKWVVVVFMIFASRRAIFG